MEGDFFFYSGTDFSGCPIEEMHESIQNERPYVQHVLYLKCKMFLCMYQNVLKGQTTLVLGVS